MRLAELATVSNSECLKSLCVGVMVGLVVRLYFLFFIFYFLFHLQKDAPGQTRHRVQIIATKTLCI